MTILSANKNNSSLFSFQISQSPRHHHYDVQSVKLSQHLWLNKRQASPCLSPHSRRPRGSDDRGTGLPSLVRGSQEALTPWTLGMARDRMHRSSVSRSLPKVNRHGETIRRCILFLHWKQASEHFDFELATPNVCTVIDKCIYLQNDSYEKYSVRFSHRFMTKSFCYVCMSKYVCLHLAHFLKDL